MKGYKFRLEPNETQKKQIQETLDSARFVGAFEMCGVRVKPER